MSSPYVGEIRIFAGNYAPFGWFFCDGQLLPIADWETLFNLIGTTYGGDGQTTFALPDLRGRIPLHFGNGFTLAEAAGVEYVTLTTAQTPSHAHALVADAQPAESADPDGAFPAQTEIDLYSLDVGTSAPISPATVSIAGANLPHDNLQPYLCVNFIISMYGIYPTP